MVFQTTMDARQAERIFRIVQNGAAVTDAPTEDIPLMAPVVFDTTTPTNLPSTDPEAGQNFVRNAAVLATLTNNLFVGVLTHGVGTGGLKRQETGLAQIYGPCIGAKVTSAVAPAGTLLAPDGQKLGTQATPPITGTGGLAVVLKPVAAPDTVGTIFLRCM